MVCHILYLLGLYVINGGCAATWETDDATFKENVASKLHDDDLEQSIEAAALNAADLKLLKRKFIRSKLGTTCVLESISADADVLFDWLFITQTLQQQFVYPSYFFAAVGTVCWFLLTLDITCRQDILNTTAEAENAGQSSSKGSIFGHLLVCHTLHACKLMCVFTCLCCFFLPLPTGATTRQYRPQGWLVAVNVLFEDLPQLSITIASSILSSTFDIFTFANLVTSLWGLVQKCYRATDWHTMMTRRAMRIIDENRGGRDMIARLIKVQDMAKKQEQDYTLLSDSVPQMVALRARVREQGVLTREQAVLISELLKMQDGPARQMLSSVRIFNYQEGKAFFV
jgi:hypothetical protein